MSTEKQYIQAFNNGYVLAQHEPDFSDMLTPSLTPINSYLQGFLAGSKQHELETNKEQLFDLQQLRNKSQNRNKGLGRDE